MTNVIINKMPVVGILRTSLGNYPVLDEVIRKQRIGSLEGSAIFRVVDEEGFDNQLYVAGAYTFLFYKVPYWMEVKSLTNDVPALTQETID